MSPKRKRPIASETVEPPNVADENAALIGAGEGWAGESLAAGSSPGSSEDVLPSGPIIGELAEPGSGGAPYPASSLASGVGVGPVAGAEGPQGPGSAGTPEHPIDPAPHSSDSNPSGTVASATPVVLPAEASPERSPESASSRTRPATPLAANASFAGGFGVLAGLAIAVLVIIFRNFEADDRALPVGFVVAESLIAALALIHLRLGPLARVQQHVAVGEQEDVRHLGKEGATLADALILTNDRRRDVLGSFQESISTYANFLVVIGMVGTAWYLLANAGHFQISTHNVAIEDSLRPLLAIAPKAFAATGLALGAAAMLSLVGTFALRSIERHSLTNAELTAAWAAGREQFDRNDAQTDRLVQALERAFSERVVEHLERIPAEMRQVVRETRYASEAMNGLMGGLKSSVDAVASNLAETATTVHRLVSESDKIFHQLGVAADGTARVVAQLLETQDRVQRATGDTIAAMDRILSEYQTKLLEKAMKEAPDFVRTIANDAINGSVSQMTKTFDQHSQSLVTRLHTLSEQSFGDAKRSFLEAIQESSPRLQDLTGNVRALNGAVREFSTVLDDAQKRWPSTNEVMRTLSATVSQLGEQAGAVTPAVGDTLAALERASGALADSIGDLRANVEFVTTVHHIIDEPRRENTPRA